MNFAPSLCTVHNPRRPLKGQWIVEPKINGMRLLIEVRDGHGKAYSRKWKPQHQLQCFADHVASLYGYDCIVDGELFARDLGSTISAVRSDLTDTERLARLRFHQFDLITREEAETRRTAPIEQRKARLLLSMYCFIIEWQSVPAAEVRGYSVGYLLHGYEGIVLKKAESEYTFRCINTWQKHKPQRKNKRPCVVAIRRTHE